jgi:hypothetical protein
VKTNHADDTRTWLLATRTPGRQPGEWARSDLDADLGRAREQRATANEARGVELGRWALVLEARAQDDPNVPDAQGGWSHYEVWAWFGAWTVQAAGCAIHGSNPCAACAFDRPGQR